MPLMLQDVLVPAVAFVAGGGVTAFGFGLRQRSATRLDRYARLQESITAFGEELRGLPLTPEEAEANPQVLADYSLALSAYERAAAAESRQVALAALRDGRAALIRLAARRAGRPVPIDALPPLKAGHDRLEPADVPVSATGERFLTVGRGWANVEVLIDRPEPGLPSVIELTSKGNGEVSVTPFVRTEEEINSGTRLLHSFGDTTDRAVLPPEFTHLRIESNGWLRWSVRIRPMSAALPLGTEWRGTGGEEVLSYSGDPALLTVQARSEGSRGWTVEFVCGCLKGDDCRCRSPRWPAEMPGNSLGKVWGSGDDRSTLRLPRLGYLVLNAPRYHSHEWYLSVKPFPELPEPQHRSRRFIHCLLP